MTSPSNPDSPLTFTPNFISLCNKQCENRHGCQVDVPCYLLSTCCTIGEHSALTVLQRTSGKRPYTESTGRVFVYAYCKIMELSACIPVPCDLSCTTVGHVCVCFKSGPQSSVLWCGFVNNFCSMHGVQFTPSLSAKHKTYSFTRSRHFLN